MLLHILSSSLYGMTIPLALAVIYIAALNFGVAASTSATQNILELETELLRDQSLLITCNIKVDEMSTAGFLTCFFPHDIRQEKIGISVQTLQKNNTAQEAVLVLHCFWLDTKLLKCTKKENYKLWHGDVQNNATFQIPLEEAWLYYFSCHAQATGRAYMTEKCSLERKNIPSSAEQSPPRPTEESSPNTLVIIISVIGLALLLAVILFLAIKFRQNLIKIIPCNKDRITKLESASEDQSTCNNNADTPQRQSEDEREPFLQEEIANVSVTNENFPNHNRGNVEDSMIWATSETTSKMENRELWMNKQHALLSSWKTIKLDAGEQEIDHRLQKCLKLQYVLSSRIEEASGKEPNLDHEHLSGEVTLRKLFTEAKKTLDRLKSLQNLLIRKKVNAAIKSSIQKGMDRLKVIDDFIETAGKQADDALSIEEDSEGKEIQAYIVKIKTLTELQMLLEHHEECLQNGVKHLPSSRKAEYEKKLVPLREKFVDLKTMFENSLKQSLTSHALLCNSENSSTQTPDTHSEDCPLLPGSTIPSPTTDAETKADKEQTETQSEDCLLVTDSFIPSPKMDAERKADDEQIATLDQQFPDIDTGNFLIPAKHIRHVHTTSTLIGSKPVDVLDDPTTSQHSTRRYINDLDDVQEKLHKCLSLVIKTAARSDAMMAITQTNFGLYDKQAIGLPDAAVDENNPDNMLKLKKTYSDLMIVNKQRGILGGIVQSVHPMDPVQVEQELTDSVSKLKDAERIIKEGIKTTPKADDVFVRMTLILPNILKKQLDGKLALQKAIQNVNCLYKDDMENGLTLTDWWDASWLPRQSDTMSNNLFRNLVARFALPAIKVHNSLYKHDHGGQPKVGDTAGDDLQTERQQSPLRPDQEKLLDFDALDETQDDVKFLYGTASLAMTTLLLLRAQQWISHFKARIIVQLQTTEDRTPDLPDSTNLQTAHGTFKQVDISKLCSKDPDDGTVVLKEEGKETLLAAVGPSPPGQSHTAIHIVADKADGDVVAAVFEWLKSQHVKTVRMWAAGKDAPRNNEDGRLAVHHIK